MVFRNIQTAAMPLRWQRMSWAYENAVWDGILVLVTGEVLFGGQYIHAGINISTLTLLKRENRRNYPPPDNIKMQVA